MGRTRCRAHTAVARSLIGRQLPTQCGCGRGAGGGAAAGRAGQPARGYGCSRWVERVCGAAVARRRRFCGCGACRRCWVGGCRGHCHRQADSGRARARHRSQPVRRPRRGCFCEDGQGADGGRLTPGLVVGCCNLCRRRCRAALPCRRGCEAHPPHRALDVACSLAAPLCRRARRR